MVRPLHLAVILAVLVAPAYAQGPARPGRNEVEIRGKSVDVYYYPGAAGQAAPAGPLLFAPGDGGWRGLAVTMAQTMASWGYAVLGLDTKKYLEDFTASTTLRESDVMADIHLIAQWFAPREGEKVLLVGWLEGAGLMTLAAASQPHQAKYFGLVTIGLGDSNVLGWRWRDALTYLTKKDPNEPTFSSLAYIAKVSPLRLAMLQSSRDEYVPPEEARKLFEAAKEPKRFVTIEADNHRFEGRQEEFYQRLREALAWITQPRG